MEKWRLSQEKKGVDNGKKKKISTNAHIDKNFIIYPFPFTSKIAAEYLFISYVFDWNYIKKKVQINY